MKAKELRRDNGNCARQRCRWRVGDECGVRSADAVFTAPTGGDKLDFLVFADSQDEDNNGLLVEVRVERRDRTFSRYSSFSRTRAI